MGKNVGVLLFTLVLLFAGVSAASSPARILNGILSNTFSMLMKWILSLKATTKTGKDWIPFPSPQQCLTVYAAAVSGRPMMKFEGGYNVETVFDGSKLGIEPYTVQVLPDGDLLILDSANSNLYKIASSLSLYSRPRLVSGSGDGYYGHVDGRLRESRMNHPKGLTVDDKGNIYIADTDNMAIRKISDTGVTTIAGGKRVRGGGHVDGASEEAKFSNDFDVVYLGSSCSLLVIDRGNKAIREIQLNFNDCAYQYGSGFPLGIAVLVAAGFFGYMLALLQQRVGLIVSSENDREAMNGSLSERHYQKPLKLMMRPPLIQSEDEQERQEESFLGSLGRLVAQTGESAADILGGVFPMFKKKKPNPQYQTQHPYQQQLKYSNAWAVQESYVIPHEDEPPFIETRAPTPKKTYAFMTNDSEKMQQLRQSRAFYSGWEGDLQKQQQQTKKQHHHHHHQYQAPPAQTHYEQSPETTNEIVFGAVQEQDRRRETMVIKPLDHGVPLCDHQNIRSRLGR